MKKLVLIAVLSCFAVVIFGQDANIEKTYGGIPTANPNMEWQDNLTPNEKYIGVIQVDSIISASKIIEAFMATFQSLQDANIMTKQMRTNSSIGGVTSAMNGDYESMDDFSKAGDSDSRKQYQGQNTWTVQFIDGVRMNRFYYNIGVQAKDGRYKLTVTPSGSSGYANDHIQTEWSQMFKNGEVKSIYSKYYDQMKIKLAYTIDQWINEVDKYLKGNANNDW
ncbi:MAG TPA: hypothetical protein VLQ91_19485 [Draconibacterium sp.]|nr:hypothetical protein [Draconibacterium sp.]